MLQANASLPELLSQRQAQARIDSGAYLHAVADEATMLYWVALACRSARESAGRLQVHIGASANVDQSTINRFEKHIAWPRDADKLVAAYAEDLGIEPIQLWREALRLWQDALD